MTRPPLPTRVPTAESCAWCDQPYRGHARRWHPAIGTHGYVAPCKGLIAARIRLRYQAAGRLAWP